MSKAHKNWKQFLLTEETSDLNNEIANAFEQFEDVHPSGRPYDSGIKSEEENWTYLVCMYFMWITISTIGFGDKVPKRVMKKGYTSGIIFILMFFENN